ncbi:hypothetical protein PVL29_026014 [Vitis rotundifolia]|uniref:Uncharacterized protein n=1 Tax=Vitis rotundifolia TaxID=103349 RepID=A0AA38YLH0_VITRO|nr:hypothetical protein PVL29_026014 [Vitis rotundifolia]
MASCMAKLLRQAGKGTAPLTAAANTQHLHDFDPPSPCSQGSPEHPNACRAESEPTKLLRALEVMGKDSTVIAESFTSLFASLRLALSEVTGGSIDHMRCFSDITGRLQESTLAATTIMNPSADAWDHMQFKDVVHFYLQKHPDLISDPPKVLALRVDHTRVVDIMRKASHLHLVKPYIVAVQSNNVSAVNGVLNRIYVEEEDYDRLRESIDMHDNFDQIDLARKIEKHELLEMRCVAAYIYQKAGRWKQRKLNWR